jgi:hypothetical protein
VTKTYKISSPFIEKVLEECTQKAVAQEYYAIDLEAGDLFFDLGEINKHIAFFTRPPISRHNIILKPGVSDDELPKLIQAKSTKCYRIIKKTADGKLEVWTELIEGRPDQSFTYIFGIDVSKGQGASESVVSIKCKQTGEIIAKWTCRNTTPHEFSRIIVALSLWCGGANPQRLPYLKWEKNGPGWEVGRLLVQTFCYPHYYVTKTLGAVVEKTQGTRGEMQKYGYHTSREGKDLLLRAYERALKTGKIVNHCKASLEQAKQYIHYKDGGIGPAELVEATVSEKKLHGDKVMADALTVEDEEVSEPKPKRAATPHNCWGARYDGWKKKKKKKKRGWSQPYDFTKRK